MRDVADRKHNTSGVLKTNLSVNDPKHDLKLRKVRPRLGGCMGGSMGDFMAVNTEVVALTFFTIMIKG